MYNSTLPLKIITFSKKTVITESLVMMTVAHVCNVGIVQSSVTRVIKALDHISCTCHVSTTGDR